MSSIKSSFGNNLKPEVAPVPYSDGIWYEKNEFNDNPHQWTILNGDSFKGISRTIPSLPNGVYDINKDERDSKPVFIKKKLIHDTLISLRGLPNDVIKEINDFWGKEKVFKDLGFLHRRGYLFYGSHGTGKSSLVHEIVDGLVNNGGVVFYCDHPVLFNDGIAQFRKIEPGRKIVCVFEDIDAIIKKYGESIILSILDGENQISGVCNIATTNYPEMLDKRIVGRPRRFDRVYRIEKLDDNSREEFLTKKLPEGSDVRKWVKLTKGLSIAQISEVIISNLCFDKKIEDSIEIVKNLTEDKSSDDYKDKQLGFNND